MLVTVADTIYKISYNPLLPPGAPPAGNEGCSSIRNAPGPILWLIGGDLARDVWIDVIRNSLKSGWELSVVSIVVDFTKSRRGARLPRGRLVWWRIQLLD